MTACTSRFSLNKLLISLFSVLCLVTLLAGCAQNEPSASEATTETVTPTSGDTAKADVAESSSVDDAADGIYTLQVTQKLESLKSHEDVQTYIDELQTKTDNLAAHFNHDDANMVNEANDFVSELGNFNHYLPTLEKNGVLTADEEAEYSSIVDQMLLTIDALIAS